MYGRHHNPGQTERVKCPGCSLLVDEIDLQLHALELLHRLGDAMATDFTALNAAVTDLDAKESAAVTALNDLSAKLGAAGNSDDQAAVDGITANLTGLSSGLQSAIDTDDPAPVAAPPTDGSTPPADGSAPVDGSTDPSAPAAS